MGRRTRRRFVKRWPENNFYFESMEKELETYVRLSIAEFEAMRLKHYADLNQKDSAEKMGVSQPTFSRILDNAHKKVTTALLEGKRILISGGNVKVKKGFIGYGCLKCDNEWEDESASKDKKVECPECDSKEVYYLVKEPL